MHSFDPEATPAEKAAAAGKARDQVKSIRKQGGEHGGTGESQFTTTYPPVQRALNSDFRRCSRYWGIQCGSYHHRLRCRRDFQGGA